MATNTMKALYRNSPGTSVSDAYTVPAGTTTILGMIIACNTTGAAATFGVAIAPAGAADAVSQYVLRTFSVAANDVVTIKLDAVMSATDKIRVVQGTASAINLYISGMESV